MPVVNLKIGDYKRVNRDGITAIIINKGRILLLRRASLPFMTHKGTWSFLTGGKHKNERYINTVYREAKEELGIDRSQLVLIASGKNVIIKDNKKNISWTNALFVLHSKTRIVRLNFENRECKWVSIAQLAVQENAITTYFLNKDYVLRLISYSLKREPGNSDDRIAKIL